MDPVEPQLGDTPDDSKTQPTADDQTPSVEPMDIPVSTVAVEETTPSVGDEVQFRVKGKVTSVDGDTLTVAPDTINEKKVTASAGDTDDDMENQVNAELSQKPTYQ